MSSKSGGFLVEFYRCNGEDAPTSINKMLKHWCNCRHVEYDSRPIIQQLFKLDKTPATISVPLKDIESAMPTLYQKLCGHVHDFDRLGDMHEVIIPKCASFADADRVAYANIIACAGWPCSVSEDYLE